MRTVYKYEISVSEGEVFLPRGAKILSVGAQGEQIMLWAIVDTNETEATSRLFHVVGTGRAIGTQDAIENFIGTVFMGPYVFHVFEIIS